MNAPYYSDDLVTLHLGDCREVLAGMEAASVDAVVTDPPYDLTSGKRGGSGDKSVNAAHPAGRSRITTGGGFMGKEWDATGVAFDPDTWRAVLRVLKPGGHLLAFGGARTWHRLVCAIEDAGFEIRDPIADLTGMDAPGLLWIQGQGFPKSLDVSKAIDKAAGAQREVTGRSPDSYARTASSWQADDGRPHGMVGRGEGERLVTAPATDAARQWDGWGTALKPAWEPVAVARKPLEGTVASNVLAYGTGALNLAACKVPHASDDDEAAYRRNASGDRGHGDDRTRDMDFAMTAGHASDAGRWPPNVLLGEEAATELDRQSGVLTSGANPARRGSDKFRDAYGDFTGQADCAVHRGADSGGASRFFPVFRYEAKAPASERPRIRQARLRLRDDLTPEDRDYVLAELRKAGVDVA